MCVPVVIVLSNGPHSYPVAHSIYSNYEANGLHRYILKVLL
jgi:hypothetical protein